MTVYLKNNSYGNLCLLVLTIVSNQNSYKNIYKDFYKRTFLYFNELLFNFKSNLEKKYIEKWWWVSIFIIHLLNVNKMQLT